MRLGWLARLLILALFLPGCGDRAPKRVVVRGRVLYQGQPLGGGTIVFTPDAEHGCYGPLARAVIEPDGTYRLETDGAAGAAPGWHRVTFAGAAPAPARLRDGRPHPLERFRHPDLSGLVREVTAEPENVLDFHLDPPAVDTNSRGVVRK
jgi:hypothetical protein